MSEEQAMKAMIVATLVLVLAAGSGRAERKPLDKIHREIKPGATVIKVPNPRRRDGYDLAEKKHEVTYNETTGLYTYRYWQTYVDLLYEPFNRLDVTVRFCFAASSILVAYKNLALQFMGQTCRLAHFV